MSRQTTPKEQSSKPAAAAAQELTAGGKPRQRAPGAGRPHAGRPVRLNARISEACEAQLLTIQQHYGFKTFVEAIEHAAQVAFDKLP